MKDTFSAGKLMTHVVRAGLLAAVLAGAGAALAQQPWERPQSADLPPVQPDPYQPPPPSRVVPPPGGYGGPNGGYAPGARPNDAYVPPPRQSGWGDGGAGGPYAGNPPAGNSGGYQGGYQGNYQGPPGNGPGGPYGGQQGGGGQPPYSQGAYNQGAQGGYGAPYEPPREGSEYGQGSYERGPNADQRRFDDRAQDGTYSRNEVLDAGGKFFGSISESLAKAVEYVFQSQGRPNGYILGEDAGGAFVAGLRYGEGTLYTKDAGNHRIYWQGPSLGYDFGGEGSKTMVLVYNLRDPSEIYNRFGGIQGSAYLVGGVGVQFQKYGDVILAPIRSGVGLRLGANVGYLKYTRAPTWNPF